MIIIQNKSCLIFEAVTQIWALFDGIWTLPRRILPRRTLPRPETSPTGNFPDRKLPRPDTSPTEHFSVVESIDSTTLDEFINAKIGCHCREACRRRQSLQTQRSPILQTMVPGVQMIL